MLAIHFQPRVRLALRVVLAALLAAVYLPLIGGHIAVAPEVAYRLPTRPDLYWLAAYSFVSCCLPVALGLCVVLKRSRFAVSVRVRRILTLLVIANLVPFCLATVAWVIATCDGCWIT
jgi:hypothetical protein